MTRQQLIALFIALAAVFGGWAYHTRKGAFTPPPEVAGEPGAEAFFRLGCVQCHAVSGLEGANGTLGPPLDGLAERAATRVKGVEAREYVKQSILEPAAYQPEGFLNVMPSFKDRLSTQELDTLVDWLLSLEPKHEP